MKKIILLLLSVYVILPILAQSKKGYIIKVDGETVYTDLGNSLVKPGDWVNIYGKESYIIHPVTHKKIYTEPEIIGKLEIGSVFNDYSVAATNDRGLLQLLKEGMEVSVINTGKAITSSDKPVNNSLFMPMQNVSSSDKIPIVIAPAQVNDVVGVGHFGGYVADVLMEQMLLCDKVRLLDRSILNAQMDEVDLAGSYIDPATAVQRAKIQGARYILQVTMQKPDVVNVRTGVPLASIMGAIQGATGTNIGAQYMSNANIATLKAEVNITTRVVDLETGEVMFMTSGKGKAKGKSSVSLEYGALGGGEMNGGVEGFKQSITGKAIQQAFIAIGRNLNRYFNGETDQKVIGYASGALSGRYDDKLYSRGGRLYLGTEKLDKEGIQMMFAENSDLYFQYKKGRKLIRWSWFPAFAGVVTGLVTMSVGEYEEDYLGAGGGLMLGGIGGTVYMCIAGKKKIKSAVNRYNALHGNYTYQPSLKLVGTREGIGLRLEF